ncbi:MAG TPA: RluA family pseudouridine synthase [Planctomycetota bacterium]|nr:RluA family pseudouridine synthase [Planctomycetota bacterium]
MKTGPRDPQDQLTPAEGSDVRRFEVGREHKGLSLFDFLDAVTGPLDRKRLLASARAAQILLNGQAAAAGATLRAGDSVELLKAPEELVPPRNTELPVLHADGALVVLDKPSGMPFSESRHGGLSALDLLRERWPSARAVHRLDKETSGVVVGALGRDAEERLAGALRAGEARVEYLAVVRGTLRETEGRIDVPLGKHRKSDIRLVPDLDHGDPCATAWRLEEALRGFALLRLWPERGGRSHQVRAHLAAAGMPALCDQLYGEDDRLLLSQLKLEYRAKRGRPERPILVRPAVHAERYVGAAEAGSPVVRSPLPPELDVALAQLRRLRPPG